MFENVLVGVDGRPNGRDAIALAEQLRDRAGAMTLAHVCAGACTASRALTPGLIDTDREEAAALLELERARAGVKAELAVLDAAMPGAGLHVRAEEQGADLLVVGSCHRAAFGRALLGDDTRAALNGAPCAVAVAPAGYAEHPQPFRSIGVGYDGSPESEAALGAARVLAARTGAVVRALQIVSFLSYGYAGVAVADAISQALSDAEARMKALPGVEGHAEYGIAGEDLAALSGEVDMLIVGSRGYGPMRRLIAGSTANHLERHARGPLLVLPRGTRYVAADAAAGDAASRLPLPA